jgi:outer membrane protein OmpA-like peptidoglycan-associated protein
MKKLLISFTLLLYCSLYTFAQDAEGCKDHPLLTRLPDFLISECEQNYKELDFYTPDGADIKFEGNLTRILYMMKPESPNAEPSTFQVIKNYKNAILKIGGKVIYSEETIGCFELKKNGKMYKIKVADFANYGGVDKNMQFVVEILEMEEMKQEISANEMLIALNKDGYISLNILFETGKSTIQAESLPIVDQIKELLSSNPALKVSVEGHTDNVGDAASNKKLSSDRAKSVMDALIAKGIDKTRLSFLGWGQEKPVGDNRTDEGKALNRRVEIVKK